MLEPSRPITAADITSITPFPGEQLSLIPDTELPAIPSRNIDGERVTCECGHCGDIHPIDDMRTGHRPIQELCPDCVRVCEKCERVGTEDDEFETAREDNGRRAIRNEQCRCNRCSAICADCDVRFHSLENQNSNGGLICEFCALDYCTCDGCSATIHSNSSFYSDSDEQTLCRSCHDARQPVEDEESEPDSNILIHEHDYKPGPTYLGGEGEKVLGRNVYLGIELETECNGAFNRNDCIKKTGLNVNPAFYIKKDGSLDNGMEIVSHPATFKYWMNADLNFCNKLIELGCRSYDTKTAGMHVHISKSALTTAQQAKLLLFVKNNQSFMLFVSRRANKSAMARWAGIDSGRTKDLIERVRDPHGYYGYRIQRHSRDCTALPADYDKLFGRYCAINLFNAKTIEFRIFRGTLDTDSIRRNLAFVVALTTYMHESPINATYDDFDVWLIGHGWCHVGKKMAMKLSLWFDKFNPRATVNPAPQIELETSQCVA